MPGSAHASVACATCHPGRDQFPHVVKAARPACASCHAAVAGENSRGVHGQAAARGEAAAPDCALCHGSAHEALPPRSLGFRRKAPDTCGMCHSDVSEQYKVSVHGQALARGVADAPLCTDCHGEHSILKHTLETSPVHVGHIRETCARCHGDLRLSRKFGLPADRVVSFDATYHGLAARAGAQSVANCASCHGIHLILASSNPQSMIHPANLPATCGHCHPGAGKRFALGPIHVVEGRTEPAAVRWARWFYLAAIPILVGGMLLHNAGDWLRKVIRPRQARACVAGPEIRMFGWERIQHALLAVSFAVLVWTGFALKYPDQWWARPLLVWEGSAEARGTIHRVASVVFILTAVLHIVTLAASRRLRQHWKLLWPLRADLPQALQAFTYNLGWRREPPQLPSHTYVEKVEYWAVVWGAVIMAASGVLLWADNFFLARLPKSFMDVATVVHFYEAVLATLAIVAWHFYFVIFDPDVYPMDTAWLTGRSPRPRHDAGDSGESA